MRNQMREREVALRIAKSRELFFWYGAFYLTSVACALTRYLRIYIYIGEIVTKTFLYSYRFKRKPIYLTPLVPMTFVVAYQADLAYGNKLHRIIG